MDEFSELEYKYNAADIKLVDFQKLMAKLDIVDKLETSSWDVYYLKTEYDSMRFRQSETPELTHKIKTKDANNWQRIEVDLPLSVRVKEETVKEFLKLIGYEENFKIFKSCFIYWTENTNYVYYIVYNENMKELGRFIEVEVNKEKVTSLLGIVDRERGSLDGPTQTLNDAADKLKELDLTMQNRMKKSLFELFKK